MKQLSRLTTDGNGIGPPLVIILAKEDPSIHGETMKCDVKTLLYRKFSNFRCPETNILGLNSGTPRIKSIQL